MPGTTVRETDFNPLAPEFLADPYPTYAELREAGRILWHPLIGAWILTRHSDVVSVLRDERFSADRRNSENFERLNLDRDLPRSMLTSDPPDHTRLRTLVNKAFTARTVRRLEGRIEAICDRLLDAVADRGEMDVVSDYAYPLPITVIAEMLGVPASDQDAFREWSKAIALALGPLTPPTVEAAAVDARNALVEYFDAIVEHRRTDPRDDLVSALIAAEEEGERLTHGELLAMLLLLLIAGHETTVNLIGNGVHALLRRPEALARLRADPALDHTTVEECLRYDSPVQLTGRVVMEPVEIAGVEVAPKQSVLTLLGSANRDPEVFDRPESFDIAREENPHVSFSAGIHFCLGAQLARLEGRIAIPKLLRRFQGAELASDDLTWRPAVILRGLEALPVRL